MFVKNILDQKSSDLVAVSPGDTVREVGSLFKVKQIGFALVQSKDKVLLGTISERDIIHALADRGAVDDLPVIDIMTTNIFTCHVGDTLESVRQAMTNQRTRHVVAMQGREPMGIVSIGDMIKHSLDECRIDSDHMVQYINGQGYQ